MEAEPLFGNVARQHRLSHVGEQTNMIGAPLAFEAHSPFTRGRAPTHPYLSGRVSTGKAAIMRISRPVNLPQVYQPIVRAVVIYVVYLIGPRSVPQEPHNTVRLVLAPKYGNFHIAEAVKASRRFFGKSSVPRRSRSCGLEQVSGPFAPKKHAGIFIVPQKLLKQVLAGIWVVGHGAVPSRFGSTVSLPAGGRLQYHAVRAKETSK
jgi:hypothetical protein